MALEPTADQRDLRAAVAAFLADRCSEAVVRAAEPLGMDASLWAGCARMGLPGLTVPAEHGGAGAGFVEAAMAAELLGRHVAPVPFVEVTSAVSVLAEHAAVAGAREAIRATLAGELVPTVCLHPVIHGAAPIVPAGAVADVVIALRDDELVMVAAAEGVRGEPLVPNLGSMPLARWELAEAQAVVLAAGTEARRAFARLRGRWQALTAIALIGLGLRAIEIALEYTKERKAFGTPVAHFQTVQHRFADDATALEGGRLLAYKAAWAQAAEPDHAEALGASAFLFASEAAIRTTDACLHFHGGYGFTLEYAIQLYFRRARAWSQVFGDRRGEYVRLARLLFDDKRGIRGLS
jgi:alkylation response protein AidB-like acyl-CoA dehydrogenase